MEPARPQAPPTRKGIGVFDDGELEIESEPMGETQIAASVKGPDSVGSGSGLLDLTRESIDTSLGALAPNLVELAAAATQGIWPSFLKIIARGTVHYAVFDGLALVAIAIGVMGILAERK